MLSRRASNKKRNKIERQKRSDVAELERTSAELKKMLKGAEERIAKAGLDVRGDSQGMKRRAAEIGRSSGSERRSNANGSPELQSLKRKKES